MLEVLTSTHVGRIGRSCCTVFGEASLVQPRDDLRWACLCADPRRRFEQLDTEVQFQEVNRGKHISRPSALVPQLWTPQFGSRKSDTLKRNRVRFNIGIHVDRQAL
jgi:hypothetical protein